MWNANNYSKCLKEVPDFVDNAGLYQLSRGENVNVSEDKNVLLSSVILNSLSLNITIITTLRSLLQTLLVYRIIYIFWQQHLLTLPYNNFI